MKVMKSAKAMQTAKATKAVKAKKAMKTAKAMKNMKAMKTMKSRSGSPGKSNWATWRDDNAFNKQMEKEVLGDQLLALHVLL